MTLDSGASRRMIRVASTPSIPGMDMSMSTTSGRRLFAFSTASKPSPASPHTTQSRRDDSRARTPRLTVSWSSTIRMRNEPMPFSPKPLHKQCLVAVQNLHTWCYNHNSKPACVKYRACLRWQYSVFPIVLTARLVRLKTCRLLNQRLRSGGGGGGFDSLLKLGTFPAASVAQPLLRDVLGPLLSTVPRPRDPNG